MIKFCKKDIVMENLVIPTDVPINYETVFIENYQTITKETGRLLLFSADQKIEHLNKDFYGKNIPKEVNDPEHLFKIAAEGEIGAFATQLGLISRYGKKYPNINYVAKLNSKTNIISKDKKDPISEQLWHVYDVIELKEISGLNICGVGYTVYLGSEHEGQMLEQAAQLVYEAHKYGLVTILWMYPRGKYVKNEKYENLIAGAAGVANCLGTDFAKINPPEGKNSAELLQQATAAAGNTKLICAGGQKKDDKEFLKELYDQIHIGGTYGNAIGRNIFQRPLKEAIEFTKAISEIVYGTKIQKA